MDEGSSGDVTRDSSDASIVRLPTFGIPINQLASLKQLMQPNTVRETSNPKKIVLLAGILDIDGPDYVQIKKGIDIGLEVAHQCPIFQPGEIFFSSWTSRAQYWVA